MRVTRRHFLQTGAAAAAGSLAAGTLPVAGAAQVAGSDALRVGVVGCGGRGTGAAFNALEASERVHVVALADAFADRLQSCREHLAEQGCGRRWRKIAATSGSTRTASCWGASSTW